MVRHIIIWDFADELSEQERLAAAAKIKCELERLVDVIDGLEDLCVYTEMLPTANGDIMLDSLLRDEAALAVYAEHPEHIAVKDYIATVVKSRKCVDFRM